MNIITSDLVSLRDAIRKKEISAEEVVKVYSQQIKKHNPTINAFVTLNEKAEEMARSVDKKMAAGQAVGPLAGIPVGIKDMFCTEGLRTTAASKILHN